MFLEKALIAEMARLRQFALRLTKNMHHADDLLQATMLRALEKKQSFEANSNLFSWTSRIMFNLFVTAYRQRKKFETQFDPAPYINKISTEATQESHFDLVIVNEKMKDLSDEHRQILFLVGIQGMSYEETAQVLDLPLGTIRSRLSRARVQLRVLLDAAPRRIPFAPAPPPYKMATVH